MIYYKDHDGAEFNVEINGFRHRLIIWPKDETRLQSQFVGQSPINTSNGLVWNEMVNTPKRIHEPSIIYQ